MEPPMNADKRRLDNLTETIIGCAYWVSNVLGVGFLEKVYENALSVELKASGIPVEQQKLNEVRYNDQIVGNYNADLLVEGLVIVELKVTKALNENHMAQCLNYLKATHLKVCLLINFGLPKVEVKRIVNDFLKKSAFIGAMS